MVHHFFLYLCLSSVFAVVSHVLAAQNKPIYGQHKLITYVVDWDVPKVIPWDKLDHIAYAFAVPDERGKLSQFEEEQLNQLVQEAHHHEKGVSLAIGGWTGSIHFSSLVRNSQSRQHFAKILVNAVEKYDLNGLNIDWEYPNDPNGISCNKKHPKDTDNFLELIKLVRTMLDNKYPDEHKLITSAVSANVFKDSERRPIENLDKAWSTDMDAFYIMAYDINGVHSTATSANAPLYLGETGMHISAKSSVEAWIKAGIPSERIFLGVPFYGYTHKTKGHMSLQSGMNTPLNREIAQIKGDQHDDFSKDPCPGAVGSFSGEYQWRTLLEAGAAHNASGWYTFWDEKTRTPYAYHHEHNQFITFDDPVSLRIKTEFTKEHKLGGIMLWSLEMDDTSNSLLNAMQAIRG